MARICQAIVNTQIMHALCANSPLPRKHKVLFPLLPGTMKITWLFPVLFVGGLHHAPCPCATTPTWISREGPDCFPLAFPTTSQLLRCCCRVAPVVLINSGAAQAPHVKCSLWTPAAPPPVQWYHEMDAPKSSAGVPGLMLGHCVVCGLQLRLKGKPLCVLPCEGHVVQVSCAEGHTDGRRMLRGRRCE